MDNILAIEAEKYSDSDNKVVITVVTMEMLHERDIIT
jgi:hypothetical protein